MSEEKPNKYETKEEIKKDIENINKLYSIIDGSHDLFNIDRETKNQLIKGIRGDTLVLTKDQQVNEIYNKKFFNNPSNNAKLSQLKQFKTILDKVDNKKKEFSEERRKRFEKFVKRESPNVKFEDLLKSFNTFYNINDIDDINTVGETVETANQTIKEKEDEINELNENIKKQTEMLNEKKEQLEHTNNDLNKKKEILQNIVSQGTNLKNDIANTKQQLETLHNEAKEILNPVGLLMESKDEIQKQFNKLQTLIKYKEEELKELSNKYNDVKQDYNDLQKELEIGEAEKEKLRADIIDLNKQGEEKLRKLKEYDNELLNRRTAEAKHKGEEQGIKKGISLAADKISREEAAETAEIEKKQIKPEHEQYIKNKVMEGIYKLPREEIINAIQKDIDNGKISTDNPEKLAAEIYLESVRYVKKNARSIAKLVKMQGYNPTQFSKLPGILQQYVNDYVTEKNKKDLINKNRKYILPKDLPRWERATQQHNVNPMLGRGAWSH